LEPAGEALNKMSIEVGLLKPVFSGKATVIKRGGKLTGNHKNWYNVRDDDGWET
jgi:hypothetical protein